MGSNQNNLHDLLLSAYAEGHPQGVQMQRCIEALRALQENERSKIGVPHAASDLEFFEYIMRTGGILLLALDRKKH